MQDQMTPEEADHITLSIDTDYSSVQPFNRENTTFTRKLNLVLELLMRGYFIKIKTATDDQFTFGLTEEGDLYIVGKAYEAGSSVPHRCVFGHANWFTSNLLFQTVNAISEEGVSKLVFHSVLSESKRKRVQENA